MSLMIRLAYWWTPAPALARMLDRMAEVTTDALDGLMDRYAPGDPATLIASRGKPNGNLKARRSAMAAAHDARVTALVNAIGRERAIAAGREALFAAGETLGREARARLGAGDSAADLERAARILYRALGIHFEIEKGERGTMVMRVDRCALAEHYSAETCEVLSAADEGVMHGLNPAMRMRFEKKMTCGHPVCLARISEETE